MTSREFHIDENDSVWAAEVAAEAPARALAGTVRADLAIVGGGLAGLSVAWHALRRFPDQRVVLLEAKTVGNGATGRSGGQALTGLHGASAANEDELRRFYEITKSGIDRIESWVGELGIADAGFSRTGSLEIVTSDANAEATRAEVERWQRAGIPVRWLPGAETPVRRALGAIFDPAGARLNPLALVRALRADVVMRGGAVFEGSPVVSLEAGRLVTLGGEVTAPDVVVTAGAYAPRLRFFRSRVLPLHSHVVATAPIGAAQWAASGWGEVHCFTDDRDRIAYGTRTPQGHLLFGGGDNAAYDYLLGGSPVWKRDPKREGRAFEAIELRLRDYFPKLAGVPIEHRWTGTVDLTLDRVCSIAKGHALGFSGHGLALAALAGRVITDLQAGEGERWQRLPFLDRVPPRLPPEPFRWLGYQIYTRLTGRSPRRRA